MHCAKNSPIRPSGTPTFAGAGSSPASKGRTLQNFTFGASRTSALSAGISSKAAAAKLVDELKATRGKEDARAKAKAVREEVKPAKNPKPAKVAGTVATEKDRRIEAPGAVAVSGSPGRVLDKVSSLIEQNKRPDTVLASLDEKETAALATQLREQFDRGRKT